MKKNDTTKDEALEKLRQLLSRQEKCTADVREWLRKWGIDPSHHDVIIETLTKERFLDEIRYAAALVKDKIKLDHWGIIKIRYLMRQKGLPGAAIDQAISGIDQEEYREMVSRELAKKRKTIRGTKREVWVKLARYGFSRGYEMDVMRDFLGDDPESTSL